MDGKALCWQVCRLSDATAAFINDTRRDLLADASRVSEVRQRARAAPSPAVGLQEAMADIALHRHDPERTKPGWLGTVAFNREVFASSAWSFKVGGDTRYYKFLFAMQSPLYVLFSPLVLGGSAMVPTHVDSTNWDSVGLDPPCQHHFVADLERSVPWDQVPDVPIDCIAVMFGLVQVGGNDIFCNGFWGSLQDAVHLLPHRASVSAGRSGNNGQHRKGEKAALVE